MPSLYCRLMAKYGGPEVPHTNLKMKTQLRKVEHNNKSQNTIANRKTRPQNKNITANRKHNSKTKNPHNIHKTQDRKEIKTQQKEKHNYKKKNTTAKKEKTRLQKETHNHKQMKHINKDAEQASTQFSFQ